jgi:hypothetical protein
MIPAKVDVTNVVQELEKRLLPSLQKVAEEISKQFPRVKASVWSSPVGSLTDLQGHDLGIDCLITDAGPDETDSVALSVGVRKLTTTPLIDQAGVCWGASSGQVEAELYPDPIEVTDESLQELEAQLPFLYDALKRAVKRGHPPDEK